MCREITENKFIGVGCERLRLKEMLCREITRISFIDNEWKGKSPEGEIN